MMIISLQRKIILGYSIIATIITGIIVIIISEYSRFQKFETVLQETNCYRENIYKAHLCITKLATLGETVITWDDSDYNKYHYLRLKTDSTLLEIKLGCVAFVRSEQIDSLRILLETKEIHLFRIMKSVQSWEKSDSLLANELPVIARQTIRMKTITQKKKGIAGMFGRKETIQVPYTNYSE